MNNISYIVMFIFAGVLTNSSLVYADETNVPFNADSAIMLLKNGNDRFVNGESQHLREDQERRTLTTVHGQHPFATILSCSDSRVPLEVIFDAGIGELFVIRVAGNVADGDELGSIEYGAGHLQTPLLLVLGHTKCGAVTAAVQNSKVEGNILNLISKIKPVVGKTMKNHPLLTGDSLILVATSANVWQSIENTIIKSEEIRHKVKNGELKIIGGIYDIETGKVSIMGQHPYEDKFLKFTEGKSKAKHVEKAETKNNLNSTPKKLVRDETRAEGRFRH